MKEQIENKIKLHNKLFRTKCFLADNYFYQQAFDIEKTFNLEELKYLKEQVPNVNKNDKNDPLFLALFFIMFNQYVSSKNKDINVYSEEMLIAQDIVEAINLNRKLKFVFYIEIYNISNYQEEIKTEDIMFFLEEFKSGDVSNDDIFPITQKLISKSKPMQVDLILEFFSQDEINKLIDFTEIQDSEKGKNTLSPFFPLNMEMIRLINYEHEKILKAKEFLAKKLILKYKKIKIDNSYYFVNKTLTVLFYLKSDKKLLNLFMNYIVNRFSLKGGLTHTHSADIESLKLLKIILNKIEGGDLLKVTAIDSIFMDIDTYLERPPIEHFSFEELKREEENQNSILNQKFKDAGVEKYYL